MIDLDAIWTEEDELYSWLFLPYLQNKVTWSEWRIITESLGMYEYIWPANRVASVQLAQALVAFCAKRNNDAWIYEVASYMAGIEVNYTEQQQLRIAELIASLEPLRMEKSPENCAIIDEMDLETNHAY